MIRPAAFGFNKETASNNHFQTTTKVPGGKLQQQALAEFDGIVKLLEHNNIQVIVIDDTAQPAKPDAVVPNNWISTSPEGIVSVFPLYASNRRPEKREDILDVLGKRFVVKDVQDWSEFEV